MSIASAAGTNGLGMLGNQGGRVPTWTINRLIQGKVVGIDVATDEDDIEVVERTNDQTTISKISTTNVRQPTVVKNSGVQHRDDTQLKVHVDSHSDGKQKRSVATIVIENQSDGRVSNIGSVHHDRVHDHEKTITTRVRRVSLSRLLCPWIAGLLVVGAVTGIVVGVVLGNS